MVGALHGYSCCFNLRVHVWFLLDDDGVGYEQQGIGIYILLEIFTVICYFAILPFVWRRRYSTKRKTDIELVDGDDDSEEEIGRDSLLSQSSEALRGVNCGESGKTDGVFIGVAALPSIPVEGR